MLSALATMFTPGVLVSATNVMCDVMLACLWVWAIVLWERGLRNDRRAVLALIGMGLCIAAATLTKYFGFALVPLLAVHGLMRLRRPGWWLLALLIPVVVVGLFDWWAYRVYGHGLVLDAAGFSSQHRLSTGLRFYVVHTAIGLAFTGGCAASALFFWPRLWSHWMVISSLLLMAIIALAIGLRGMNADDPSSFARIGWSATMQAAVWITVGAGILALPIMDLRRRFDAISVTLALWVWGTFVFAAYLNWSVTARTILPMIPAVGILIARAVQDDAARRGTKAEDRTIILPLALAAALALAVTWGDFVLANSARTAARYLAKTWSPIAGELLFQGHWGFQYYMQQGGGEPMDLQAIAMRPGDRLVMPRNNCNLKEPANLSLRQLDHHVIDIPWFVTTNGARQTAGYYSSVLGSLPFAFGPVPPEVYDVYALESESWRNVPRATSPP
jgi:4-amino-4-deoxy-L-arabinose transferase-like glycosyltransferase